MRIMTIPESISKIIHTLESTKLRFYDGYIKDPEGWRYCANGVLILETGYYQPKDLSGDVYVLSDLIRYEDVISDMKKKYGIWIDTQYRKGFYCPFVCDEMGHCKTFLKSLEQVITHINDDHNMKRQHKETARIMKVLSELYNLETGERLVATVR